MRILAITYKPTFMHRKIYKIKSKNVTNSNANNANMADKMYKIGNIFRKF